MKTLTLAGEGGQGCRVIAMALAKLLTNQGYETSIIFDYDSAVRGGMSCAYLSWDKNLIENPVVEVADFMLRLSLKPKYVRARAEVRERGLGGEIEIPFTQMGIDNFGKEIFGNMIATGFLIKELDIQCSPEELETLLPRKYKDENRAALQLGMSLNKEDFRVKQAVA